MAGMFVGQMSYAVPLYTITDLGLGGAYAVNNAGQVTGVSGLTGEAFIYNNGVMTGLGTLGGSMSIGLGINNLGEVTGFSYLAGNSEAHAFVYSNGIMTDITPTGAGGPIISGMSINDAGQVAINTGRETFLYSNGTLVNMGNFGGGWAESHGINNLGQVTGYSRLPNGDNHAFLYSNGVMEDLGSLGGTTSFGYGINDSGEVTGYSNTQHFGGKQAVIYSNGVMYKIDTLGGEGGIGFDINNFGQIIGISDTIDDGKHPFLFSDGVMTDLNSLFDPQLGWNFYAPRGINDAGQIVGIGNLNGLSHGFLLTPITSIESVPEPETYSIFALGLALLVWVHRKPPKHATQFA